MARIPYFDIKTATGRAAEIYPKLPPLNIFRMMGHAGDMLDGFLRLGNFLLARGKLDPILREIAIIRVGVLSRARYEIQQHEEIGRRLGLSDDVLAAIHEGADALAFDEPQRLVMRFTDDVVANVRAGDDTFHPLQKLLTHGQLQELTMTVGYYMMVCRFLETYDVDLEERPADTALKLPGMARRSD